MELQGNIGNRYTFSSVYFCSKMFVLFTGNNKHCTLINGTLIVEENQVSKYFNKPGNSGDPSGIYMWTLRKLANAIARSLLIIVWIHGRVSEDWRKANVSLFFKKTGQGQEGEPRQLQACQSLLTTLGWWQNKSWKPCPVTWRTWKSLVRSSHHWLAKGKSCLTNLTTFRHEMTGLVVEVRTVGVVYLQWDFWHRLPQYLHD